MQKLEKIALHKFISDNIWLVNALIQAGKLPTSLIVQYKIYLRFNQLEHFKTMERYAFLMKEFNCCLTVVQKAIKEMNR